MPPGIVPHLHPSTPERTGQRATREAGRSTRAAILDAASRRFRDRGLGGVSIADIARAADVFPSQISYYFGSKDQLFVESACRDVLHAAAAVERSGARAGTPAEYVRAIVTEAIEQPGLLTFAEAMLLAGRHPELSASITRTFDVLHREGARAVAQMLARHDWGLRTTPDVEARGFWATVIGVVLQRAATGEAFRTETAEAAVALVLNLHPEAG